MKNSITIYQTLTLGNPIVDVRSEKEFAKGHIPGALNIPLLNDKEREAVGIEYRHQGSEAAERLGYKLVSPRFPQIKRQLQQAGHHNKVVIQCWRGGKRSKISCDLAQEAGLETSYVDGGYRSYRRWSREKFHDTKKIYAISGKTGSGKTELLGMLCKIGYQTLDLENLANHKGSVFGALGKIGQPTQEMFENKLAFAWHGMSPNLPLFIENESRMIGKLFIPEDIFQQMKKSIIIDIELPQNIRKKRIFSEYGSFSKQDLLKCTSKLKKRLGGLRFQKIASSLDNKDKQWIDVLLDYYDKCYLHHREKHQQKVIHSIKAPSLINLCDELLKLIMEY